MGRGAKRDEHMPDSMVERVLLVIVKEIRTNRIENALGDDPEERRVGHVQPHRVEYRQRHPTHRQVQRQ